MCSLEFLNHNLSLKFVFLFHIFLVFTVVNICLNIMQISPSSLTNYNLPQSRRLDLKICRIWSFKYQGCKQGGWNLATSSCVLAWVYTWNSLLAKNIKRLWPIHTVQTSNLQYAFGVQVYGEVLYLEFTQFSQNSLLTMKYCSVKDCKCKSSCENGILHPIKE